MFKKLRNRIMFINLSTLVVVLVTAFTAIYLVTYINARNENRRRLDARPALTGRGLSVGRDEKGAIAPDYVTMVAGSVELSMSFDIYLDMEGGIVGVLSHIDFDKEAYDEAAGKVWAQDRDEGRLSFGGRDWIYKRTPVTTTVLFPQGFGIILSETIPGYQVSFLDVTETNRTLSGMLMIFLISGAGMFALLFAVSFVFANRAIRPISESFERQKQFVTDASHELRTPLTVIDANIDAVSMNEGDTVKSQLKWLDYIKTETKRMNQLIGEMLYLSKSEEINPACEELKTVDFSRVVEEAALSMEAAAFENGASFTCQIEPDITVKGNEDKLCQVLHILLDNAVKYSEGEKLIAVSLTKHRSKAVLQVRNHSGIGASDIEKVFDRFFRADASRSSEKGGYGLGLSIAKTIVDGCGGDISARSVDDSAVEFTVTLK